MAAYCPGVDPSRAMAVVRRRPLVWRTITLGLWAIETAAESSTATERRGTAELLDGSGGSNEDPTVIGSHRNGSHSESSDIWHDSGPAVVAARLDRKVLRSGASVCIPARVGASQAGRPVRELADDGITGTALVQSGANCRTSGNSVAVVIADRENPCR